jgi:nucleoside-diphosphate-sugar epimerase
MLDHTIAAASSSGATVLLPGTVYNYGPDAWADLHEQAPQNPLTRKGAIRVEMERRLAEAARQGGLRAIVLRAGDFFGPGAANNWFSQGLVRPGRPVTRIVDPGARGIGHQWAYLPDVGAAMVRLLERRHLLPAMARFHMDGHWDPNGSQMVQTIRDVVQRRAGNLPRVWRFPWGLARLASPWVPFLREVQEMRYLWERPVRLRGELLAELLGQDLPHTPWEDAVERTLESMGCLAPAPTRGMSEPRTHAPSGAALPAPPVTPPARHATGAPAR